MSTSIVSKEWTPEERLKVIAEIAGRMIKHPAVIRDKKLMDIQERLTFLALGSAEFLEINRKSIIEGQA
jgi:hypothetical protein